MAAGGQTINDRLNAVRYALSGQGLARTVCKATTLEVLGPKKKHIDYLLACTNEPNVSTPELANLLIERTQHTNWAVVFKSLISIHHLMSYGNEKFTQYLATSNHNFELTDFMDRTTPQGYNMSAFVRRYAKYINDKTISYRTLAIDVCKIRSGNDNALRTMNMDNLSKTLPIVQAQFDSLLEFCAEPKDLSNGVILAAFRLLYKDLVRLYVAYQEAIINLLERYFKLSRKKTREALEMYKTYLARMDKVAEFLRVVDAVGLDKSEQIDLTKSSASILPHLEQHLAQLEAKKRGGAPSSPGGETKQQDDAEASKENEKPAEPQVAKDASPTVEAKTEKQPDNPAGPSKSHTAEGAAKSEKTPPQKPARPVSPATSPRVSPKASKSPQPPPAASPSPSSGAGSKPAAPSAEKKCPPERPAKPPSRPPPPSSSASAATSPPAKVATPSPTPPPHPPPPPAHPAHRPTTPSTQVTPTSEEPPAPPATVDEIPANTNGQTAVASTADETPSTTDPPRASCASNNNASCASAAPGETSEDINNNSTDETNHNAGDNGDSNATAASEEVSQEANHINNGNTDAPAQETPVAEQEEAEEEMLPPPPPPIDDIDEQLPPPPPPVEVDDATVEDSVASNEVNGQNESND